MKAVKLAQLPIRVCHKIFTIIFLKKKDSEKRKIGKRQIKIYTNTQYCAKVLGTKIKVRMLSKITIPSVAGLLALLVNSSL